jgi:hypothetical protein
MKTALMSLRLAISSLLLISLHAFGQAGADVKKWTSPDGTSKLSLVGAISGPNNPPIMSLVAEINGTSKTISEPSYIKSRVIREYAGTAWLQNVSPNWVDNRYAVFEQGQSLCIIDASTGTMLLDTVFEALTDGPTGLEWAAIRYRPLARTQGHLRGGEKDKLFVINIPSMVNALSMLSASQIEPFGHLKAVVLPGVALATPLWKADGEDGRILVGVWNWNSNEAEVLSFSPSTLKVINRATMNLAVPESVIYSPWINQTFESKVTDALNSSSL